MGADRHLTGAARRRNIGEASGERNILFMRMIQGARTENLSRIVHNLPPVDIMRPAILSMHNGDGKGVQAVGLNFDSGIEHFRCIGGGNLNESSKHGQRQQSRQGESRQGESSQAKSGNQPFKPGVFSRHVLLAVSGSSPHDRP